MAYKIFDVRKFQESIKKKQETINRNSKKLKSAPKSVTIGWDGSSGTYPEQGGKSVAYIAKIHEYGLGYHSAKHMIGNTIFENQKKWAKMYKGLVRKSIKKGNIPNYYDIAETLGQRLKDDLKEYIYRIDLVDTSRLANAIIVRYHRR